MPQQPYLEYLHCLECGYVLATVTEHDGRTAIALTGTDVTEVIVFRALVICPHCGAERDFYSAQIGDAWQIGQEMIDKQGG